MRVSISWICDLLGVERLPVDNTTLVAQLTAHLAEIEGIESTGPELTGVVCGRVTSCEQHPDADRLRCTTVDVGGEADLPIVCGAPNVAAGQAVAVATIGTKLTMTDANGDSQTITIKKGKLRGQPSHGMICAEDELGLGSDHDGIFVLDGDPEPGTPLTDHLRTGDDVLVVDNHNINHRPDLWGHHGWAREVAAILGLEAPQPLPIEWTTTADDVSVTISDGDCLAYRGAVVSGVSNATAPEWMRQRLEACGIRPLGLLVDITNYVMLETGEPMHAFDRRHVPDGTISVRRARAGEKIVTLDGQDRELSEQDLVIANNQAPMALAGIMGGELSGVQDDTDTIVLEAATFRAATVRRSRIRHGLATDSASRFEKHLPTELTAVAINRAIALLRECCPDAKVLSTFTAQELSPSTSTVIFDPNAMQRLVGLNVSTEQQIDILSRLGFPITDGQAQIPWWRRRDVENSADLVEEVARIRGYDQVIPEVPRLPARAPEPNRLRQSEHTLRRGLAARGWCEVQTYAFTSEAWQERLGWTPESVIALSHPLASDQSVLRQSLLPTLLEAAGRNRRFSDRVAIFEVGKVYGKNFGKQAGESSCADETLHVAGVYSVRDDEQPFYAARDAAIAALATIGFTATVCPREATTPDVIAGRCADIVVNGQTCGLVSDIPPELCRAANLEAPSAWFDLSIEQLLATHGLPAPVAFSSPSRYQRVERDFTFVCPEALSFAELSAVAVKATRGLGRAVNLAQPVFRGDSLPANHKAVSLRVTLQADDRTLSEKELTKASQSVIKSIEKQTQARLKQ